MESLLQQIKSNQIQEIDIWGNQIGVEGRAELVGSLCDQRAKHIANALVANTSVHVIDLWKNQIGDEGAKHIANALMSNTSLRVIHLWKNQIGDKGAKHIASALLRNTSVQVIYLGSNRIGYDGTKHIRNTLKINPYIYAEPNKYSASIFVRLYTSKKKRMGQRIFNDICTSRLMTKINKNISI